MQHGEAVGFAAVGCYREVRAAILIARNLEAMPVNGGFLGQVINQVQGHVVITIGLNHRRQLHAVVTQHRCGPACARRIDGDIHIRCRGQGVGGRIVGCVTIFVCQHRQEVEIRQIGCSQIGLRLRFGVGVGLRQLIEIAGVDAHFFQLGFFFLAGVAAGESGDGVVQQAGARQTVVGFAVNLAEVDGVAVLVDQGQGVAINILAVERAVFQIGSGSADHVKYLLRAQVFALRIVGETDGAVARQRLKLVSRNGGGQVAGEQQGFRHAADRAGAVNQLLLNRRLGVSDGLRRRFARRQKLFYQPGHDGGFRCDGQHFLVVHHLLQLGGGESRHQAGVGGGNRFTSGFVRVLTVQGFNKNNLTSRQIVQIGDGELAVLADAAGEQRIVL